MAKHALIVVDIQNDYFPGGKWPLVGIDGAADNAARVIAATRAAGDAVIHLRHEFASDKAPFFVPGSAGAQINAKAATQSGEAVIVKQNANSFRATALKETLDRQGVEEVTVIGAMSHMCVDATVRAAADFGYKVTVVQDACATTDLDFNGVKVPAAQVHAAFMSALGFAYAAVRTTDEHVAALAAGTTAA